MEQKKVPISLREKLVWAGSNMEDYLKGDRERIAKKIEELNMKYRKMKHEKLMEKLEKRYEYLKRMETVENLNFRGRVLREAYEDVIKLEKKE